MTQKMILLPVERVKALEKLTTDSKRPFPPDIEVKLLQQDRMQSRRPPQPVKSKPFSMEKTVNHMPKEQAERTRKTLSHMANHKDRIKYDKTSGEIQYDGVKAVDSDVRELLSTLTSNKKRRTTPKGWDLFMTSLKDTEAPADVHLGWKWSKVAEKGDWGALKNE